MTIARGGTGSDASPCSPSGPLIRCAARRPTSLATSGADAATVWKLRGSTRITRDGSQARKPTGKTVPSVIGTSPKMSPGSRRPTIRSMPSTDLDDLDASVDQAEERSLPALLRCDIRRA